MEFTEAFHSGTPQTQMDYGVNRPLSHWRQLIKLQQKSSQTVMELVKMWNNMFIVPDLAAYSF